MRPSLLRTLVSALLLPSMLAPGATAAQESPASSTTQWESGEPVPEGYVVRSTPRAWMFLSGGTLFLLSYTLSVSYGLSGHATRHRSGNEFGSAWLLSVPVAGPLLFDDSYCEDAKEYYEGVDASDEPHDSCVRGVTVTGTAIAQGLGALLFGLSFAYPEVSLERAKTGAASWPVRVGVVPHRGGGPVVSLTGVF